MAASIVIQMISQSGQRANITGLKTNISAADLQNVSTGKAQAFDTFGRSLANLSKYTYLNTTVTYTFDINEIVNEGADNNG